MQCTKQGLAVLWLSVDGLYSYSYWVRHETFVWYWTFEWKSFSCFLCFHKSDVFCLFVFLCVLEVDFFFWNIVDIRGHCPHGLSSMLLFYEDFVISKLSPTNLPYTTMMTFLVIKSLRNEVWIFMSLLIWPKQIKTEHNFRIT